MATTLIPTVAGGSTNFSQGGLSFLQLVQRLRQECGVNGTISGVKAQAGEMARLVSWISSAWMDIQTLHPDWLFMQQPISFPTQAGKRSYNRQEAGIASFGNYKLDSFRLYKTSEGTASEQILTFLPYDTFRDLYIYGSQRDVTQKPTFFTLSPQKDFLLGDTPDDTYTVNGEGYALPTEMSENDDRPNMPPQFHMAIVYRAMMFYGQYEGAPEVYQHGEREFNKMIARLSFDQLPCVTWGAPLA